MLPTVLDHNQKELSPALRTLLKMVGKRSNDFREFAANLGGNSEGESTWWSMAVGGIQNQHDVFVLSSYLGSPDANVYGHGRELWSAMVSATSITAYRELVQQSRATGSPSYDGVLELFASICHILYSSAKGELATMVRTVKDVTGDEDVFQGNVDSGWAKGGAEGKGGKIVLA